MSDGQTLHALSRNTVNLIGSCQVITSVYSVIKELVENSLDASASSIDIKLESYGLEKVEVSDNGQGVKSADVPMMAKRHFTSKISSSEDLNSLTTYGFRGEALGSLCAVSNLAITTKTAEDQVSHIYTIGAEGDVLDKKPFHCGKGTTVCAKNLFHNVPVRKQYYSSSQRKKEDLKKVEYLLIAYAIVQPNLRLTLKHGKDLVFQKTSVKDMKTALYSVLGRQIGNQLLYKERCFEETELKVNAFLPKPGSDIRELSLVSNEKTFIAVNKRPVIVPELNKVLRNYYSNCHGLDNYRHPVCFVSLDVPTSQIDVNVNPNKTKVFFQQKAEIQTALEEILVEIYGPLENVPSWHYRENEDGKDANSKEIKKIQQETKTFARPCLTYIRRPGDKDESDDEMLEDQSIENAEAESSTNGLPDSNMVKSLPSFSLTFYSKVSENIPSIPDNLNTGSHEECDKNLDKNIYNIASDSGSHSDSKVNSDIDVDEIENLSTICVESSSTVDKKLTDEEVVSSCKNYTDVVSDISNTACSDKDLTSCENVAPVQEVNVIEESVEDILEGVFPLDDINIENIVEEMDKDENENTSNNKSIIDTIGLDDWSKGNITVGDSLLQPVKLLAPTSAHRPGKRPLSPSKLMELSSQPKRKTAKLSLISSQAKQATLFDLMSSQKVKKPDSPFTHFYEEKYPELSQSYPDEEDSAIKERLKEAWEDLNDEERVSYREKCWKDTKRYEKDKASIKNSDVKGLPENEIQIVKKTTAKSRRRLKNRLYCKEKAISIPLTDLRNPRQKQAVSMREEPTIIGQDPKCEDAWFCVLKDKLYLVNVWRLSEMSLYRKLKAEYKLPTKPCDPISLDSRCISERGLSALEKQARLSQGKGTYFHLMDERLQANGFDIKCHDDGIGNVICELVGICSMVPAYDVKDLNLVLEILSSTPDAPLSQTRTLKANYYLQGEAVRMTRQLTGKKTPHEVQNLLTVTMENVDQTCLHHKPVFKELFDFSSVHDNK